MSPTVDTLAQIIQACGLDLLVRLVPRESTEWTKLEGEEHVDLRVEKMVGFVDELESSERSKASKRRVAAKGS